MSLKKLGCKLLNYFLAWKVYKPSQRTSSSAVLVWHPHPSRILGLWSATWMQEVQSKLMTVLLRMIRPWCSSSCRVCRNKTGQVSNFNDRQIPTHSYANNKNESMRGRRKKIGWSRCRKEKSRNRSEKFKKRNKGLSVLSKKELQRLKWKGSRLSVKSLN